MRNLRGVVVSKTLMRLRPLSLWVALIVALALPAAAPASSSQWMTFEAPSELLDDGARDQALDEIAEFGVERVRALVYWQSHAPEPASATRPAFDASDPNAYPAGTWDRLDRLFEAASARGIKVQLTLTGPVPKWATRSRRDNVTRPSPKEFKAFATAVGRRFGDRVQVWSIWNEPNHPQFLKPQFSRGKAVSPRLYRSLFFAGVSGLRDAGQESDTVLAAETAPRGNARLVAPLRFLRGTLCLSARYELSRRCGRMPAEGWAHHAYTTKAGPRFRPSNPDDVTIGVVSRLVRALQRAERAGALPKRTGIFLTEFGIQSTPDPYVGVSLAQQAEYLAISERIAYYTPRVKSFSQYLLRDDQPRAGPKYARYSGFESGLKRSDGRPKPAYEAFRLPLAARRAGSRDSLWGRVRPAGGQTTVTILGERGDDWVEVAQRLTNSRGVFAFKVAHHKRFRLRWTRPDGTVFTAPPVRPYR